MPNRRRQLLLAAAAMGLGSSGPARAHGNDDHAKKPGSLRKEQKDWGIAGDAKAVRRTIEVRMADDMRFTPGRIDVRQARRCAFACTTPAR
jgi:hypothetical protein